MTKENTNWESYKDVLKLGMSDCDACRAVCAEYVNRRKNEDCLLFTLETLDGQYCDDHGKRITDEPPISVLSNLDCAKTTKILLKHNVYLVKTRFNWSDVVSNDLASCVIQDGWLDTDEVPAEFCETDEDGDSRDVDADKKKLIETVLWAISDDANEYDLRLATICPAIPIYIEGERFDDVWEEYMNYCEWIDGNTIVHWGARDNSGNVVGDELLYSVDRQQWFGFVTGREIEKRSVDDPELPIQPCGVREWWCEILEADDDRVERLLKEFDERNED